LLTAIALVLLALGSALRRDKILVALFFLGALVAYFCTLIVGTPRLWAFGLLYVIEGAAVLVMFKRYLAGKDRVPRSGVRVTLDAGWFSAGNDR
jgi:hypothetical protein